jgi:hypothetical protein
MDKIRCPICQHTDLYFGKIQNTTSTMAFFFPEGRHTRVGYSITESFVCLNCGHVAHFMPPDTVEELRDWVEGQRSVESAKE